MFGKKKKTNSRGGALFLGDLERESERKKPEPVPAPEETPARAPAPSAPRRRPVRAVRDLNGKIADSGQRTADSKENIADSGQRTADSREAAEASAVSRQPSAVSCQPKAIEAPVKKEPAPRRRPVRTPAVSAQQPAAKEEGPVTDIFAETDEAVGEDVSAHPFGATAFVESFQKQAEKPARPRRARRELRREEKQAEPSISRSGRLREYIRGEEEEEKPRRQAENGVDAELMEMYAPENAGKKKGKKKLTPMDWLRYIILFLCIFGFLIAAYFVGTKLYDYYRGSVLYKDLAQMVTTRDRFADDYLSRSVPQGDALTLEDVFNGRVSAAGMESGSANQKDQELMGKIPRLKEINPDTAAWITIDNTVVNYPVMWTKTRNYYLRRDFYGRQLSAGALFMDERNNPDITQNRNTVIYGHNMADGSMFASLHDFANASVFYNANIRLVTADGIYVYKAFSVHRSDAFDNYFETSFASDRAYEDFLGNMSAISMFESELEVNRSSRILTLSTCVSTTVQNNDRFVVHAVLVGVVR